MNTALKLENYEQPKMFQVYLNQAWHEVFCYAMAYSNESKHYKKLLFLIVSGSDSALQSLKASIDIGSMGGLNFGYGEKTTTGYQFHSELSLSAEKGKYEKFPMTLNQNRKALAIVHDDLLNNYNFVLSFEKNPAEDIAQLLGGSKYGLHILSEWQDAVLNELKTRKHLKGHDLYFDQKLFTEGLNLFSIDLSEEQADCLIEEMLHSNKIKFPKQGSGKNLEGINDLTSYLLGYNDKMAEKISSMVTPIHNPILHATNNRFEEYPIELFPVQSHVATSVAKAFKYKKAVIIQGEMSTGKSKIMTAVADAYQANKGKSGYFSCLMCPPSLTKKWPDEIRSLLPNAEVHVIKNYTQLIRFHSQWISDGKPNPLVPTFFIISFTTMRGDARTVPAVQYKFNNSNKGEVPYKDGFYCPTCGKPHQTIESERAEIDENGNEIVKRVTHNMSFGEFGTTRRIHTGVNPANAFCFYCGESLWMKKVPTRYSTFKEWAGYEKKVLHAIKQDNKQLVTLMQSQQPDYKKVTGMPRRVAAIEYIRRKMKNFFDITIVDEVHECVRRCLINSRKL